MTLQSHTKTLAPSLQIPKPVLVVAKLVKFVSHKLAVLFSARLFTTPIRFKTPKRELAMEESSQKSRLFIPEIKKEIQVLSYGYSDKKVLLAHGWSGRSTQLFMIANRLLEKGYMVISFDGPAHGKSSGTRTNMVEYIRTIKTINNKYGPFEAAVGHSFGGMAIINTHADSPIFKTIVTIGSGDKVEDILLNFTNSLGLKKTISKKMERHFQDKWKVQISDFAVNKSAAKIKTPTLVVHDIRDGDVAVSCAQNIRKNSKNGCLLITNGLGHTKILRDKKTPYKIVDFISQNSKK
ncbi:MAG: alpha/beta fold hydrolase [Polaribacter sp.]|nr:alpha/beta fold hydrolase [Polaribacter sp.]